jgi:hypothetical protein
MGRDRPVLFEKTSFPVVRLMHRLRTELFERDEHKEQPPLATFADVAKQAEGGVILDFQYRAPRFIIGKEEDVEDTDLVKDDERLDLKEDDVTLKENLKENLTT